LVRERNAPSGATVPGVAATGRPSGRRPAITEHTAARLAAEALW
jgi:hypothetical protein